MRNGKGFTLLEMLAVILIIAILVAVAFPAYNAVMKSARVAAVKSEISTIESSIAEFKGKFNTEPPSSIDFTFPLKPQTKAILRQMFPQIDFALDANGNSIPDVNEALTLAGIGGKSLKGSECLVFFLGGIRYHDGTTLTNELKGFAKNPSNPFKQPVLGESNRVGPFFEFDTGRLVDTDTDKALEYTDRIPGQSKPLLYLNTSVNGTYNKNDAEGVSAVWTPYKKKAGYWQPTSHQIISAGFDNDYGDGGLYDPTSPQLTQGDQDNLTNFANGLLQD